MFTSSLRFLAASAIVSLLLCSGVAPAQDHASADELSKQVRALSVRVQQLEAEQHQLLVLKELESSDSKYLELDLGKREGVLKYRTRVLRSFRFRVSGRMADRPGHTGVLALTRKEGGASSQKKLSFGDGEMLIEGRSVRRRSQVDMLFLAVGKKDLAALFHALEKGSIGLLVDSLAGNGQSRSEVTEARRTGTHVAAMALQPLSAVSGSAEEEHRSSAASSEALR